MFNWFKKNGTKSDDEKFSKIANIIMGCALGVSSQFTEHTDVIYFECLYYFCYLFSGLLSTQYNEETQFGIFDQIYTIIAHNHDITLENNRKVDKQELIKYFRNEMDKHADMFFEKSVDNDPMTFMWYLNEKIPSLQEHIGGKLMISLYSQWEVFMKSVPPLILVKAFKPDKR